jgi:hypothetical protein
MDFVKGLPKSTTASYILMVVDKFTQYAHFLPLPHPYTTQSVALVFFNSVYKLHGLPTSTQSLQATFGKICSSYLVLHSS